MTYITTVNSKGQVTIPASIRRAMELKSGESIKFRVEHNKVIIEKNDWKRNLQELYKEVVTYFKKHHLTPLDDEELNKTIDRAAEEAALGRYQQGTK